MEDDKTKEYKDMVHQFHIISEYVIDQVKIVAEGVAILNEKVDRQAEKFEKKTQETHSLMGVLYNNLDKKIEETANRLDKKIDETARKLDKKIDETKKELKADILRIEVGVNSFHEKLEMHERIMHHQ